MNLTTPDAVIARAGIAGRPEYEDVAPMTDSPGFYTFRPYLAGTELASIRTADGRSAVRCYLSFIVLPSADGGHISRVDLRAWFARRWRQGRVYASSGDPYEPPPGSPDAPSPNSQAVLARARLPLDLDSTDGRGFLYDGREDVFFDPDGRVVTPIQMLEEMYDKHCRTLRLGFRIRWAIGSGVLWAIRKGVWRGQDAAMWLLLNLYDVELVEKRKGERRNPFHKYKWHEFRRLTEREGDRSHFFGFQSSQKSLFTNFMVLVVGCLLLYYRGPRTGLLRTVYNNTALTTAALLLGFLLADRFGPWLLIGVICVLSRLRDVVMIVVRRVRV